MATKLFSDFPKAASQVPGTVTPQITEDIQPAMNIQDLATAYALQRRMREDSRNDWARAAALNAARMWRPAPQEHYLPPTASQTSGMGAQNAPQSEQGRVMWAPRNLQGAQLGTWAGQQQNRAMAENREMPIVLQAHANDPVSPGEMGAGGPYLGRGIFGPGLTSAMGGSNPYALARGYGRGGTMGAGSAVNPFSGPSLRQRTSVGPQYQYDMFGGR